jgi:hypothetical protein
MTRSLFPLLLFYLAFSVGLAADPPMLAADTPQPEAGRPIDVYLIGGQSNATGQGYMRNLPPGFKIDTDVMLFNSGRPHLDSGAAPFTWLPLRQASESPDRFGPELGFGNRIAELRPGVKIAIIVTLQPRAMFGVCKVLRPGSSSCR